MKSELFFSLCLLFFTGAAIAQTNSFPSSGNVGIGTLAPTSRLQVIGDIAAHGSIRLRSPDSNDAGFMSATGDEGYNNGIQFVSGRGNGYFSFKTNRSGEFVEKFRIQNNGNVGIGVTNPSHKLEVNGTVKAKEVNVTMTGWADYVFKPDYDLMPLSELAAFIHKNGHLPDVPTEAEVLENGVNLAEMNVKLLEKVEELTLYLIELKEENKLLRDEVNQIKLKIK